ncbi:Putative hydantoinase A/oxoprolinase, hydantoinase/oxoprolinase, ATPase, nucleotide binding protein [Colletotrichum destructivum]|uniref:Hydantoinase A/oxoprolinase, hydantoinase/oxoprolinase, ATPase, nucleotide binding protein n=1 Tax=Colletotrichum destructivum TaxID=34406 RepID=A0AAX4IV49_9PEZI|nr:Putative hydantoinase A/oxoprolinase, hydantoinase/oxoprolinase, ATPase, nucleotide binding protein [Colletotrichum destructivum]
MSATDGTLVVGVDVGGTNTDSVLLDVSKSSTDAVLASHKASTTSNVTLSVQATLKALLDKSTVDPGDITALAIGTTHFLNAIIERDTSRVEKIAVLRLASHNFSTGTPPFADWPSALKRIINGHSAIIPGGCNIDGTLIGPIDEDAVREQARQIKAKGLRNVAVVGIGCSTDKDYHQEDEVERVLRAELGEGVNVVLSRHIAGPGLLARENATILNASILNFAQRTIRAFIGAMRRIGLRCPLYLTSNAGHLLPFSEAMQAPIRIFSSGATNSIRGAAFLARDSIDRSGSIVVDIGGTTSDVGYLLSNGYPRLSKSYTALAGVKVNLEMPSVESIGLGGGSILHTGGGGGGGDDNGSVTVGPDSVGHDLVTKALCFGGDVTTATDVAVASSGASIGNTAVSLPAEVIDKGKARIRKMLEAVIDRAKLSPEPCTVILVGGGSILCPTELTGVSKVVVPEHAGVANAIGAAIAKIYGSAETIVHGSDIQRGIAEVKAEAIRNAVAKGGDERSSPVTVLHEEVAGVPYVENQTSIKIEVALPADHKRVYSEMVKTAAPDELVDEEMYEETKTHESADSGGYQKEEDDDKVVDLRSYRPKVEANGLWTLSDTDLRFLSIGCYILGCGGGGSPYASYLQLRQLLAEGESIKIVRIEDLKDDEMMPPVASVGTPAVSIERPGGDGVWHAMQEMEKEMKTRFEKLIATEIGGANGVATLIWGSSRYYDIPTVDGDMMGRAYPQFEMVSQYIHAKSINELLPVTLCSGTGHNVVIPATQTDETSAGIAIRDACVAMGSAAGASGRPIPGKLMREVGIPNTYSLAWRLGRVVALAQQRGTVASVTGDIIEAAGGPGSARVLFQGKIRGVESTLTTTAHSLGKVTVERLSESEMETETDRVGEGLREVVVPFMNENLGVLGKLEDGSETILATVPDLIFLLDTSTGEAIGVQEYRYGLKVAVMIMAGHPLWATERALEIAGPKVFGLPHDYKTTLSYTKPASVIDEFRQG